MIFSRYVGQIWKKEAGTSVISSMFVETPMWTIRPSVPQSSAVCWNPTDTRSGSSPSRTGRSIQVLGRPRLGFLVSAGNMDSMVNHYSVSKRRRDKDSYTPGGVMGKRPDYAAVVYCNLIRSVYKDIPIVIGGIEASLRRLAHYDYWSNKVKHSILVDSQADLISYGMGEKSIVEIADALNSGLDVKDITFIDGTVYKTDSLDSVYDAVTLPSYDEIKTDKRRYAESFNIQSKNTDAFS